ncbi:MAG TPA: 16S rRNA (cytidine(1402)-2'-O)-methyltransferase [Candidatus Limnocylindrales bacterium]
MKKASPAVPPVAASVAARGGASAALSAAVSDPESPALARRGRLFIVATPIGNLGDITFRAVEILRTVHLVAAEDTRLTRRLFARYEITTHLVSYHARSAPGREVELLEHMRSGSDLALVTDAGTPMVSDPGGELAGAWAAEGGTVVPIPGASAVLAALVASGLAAPRWNFEGFLPRSGRERRDRLSRIGADERACVVYEAPSRVPATLSDLAGACGGERRAAVCRELTKLHEEVVRGTLAELAVRAASGNILLRGEFAIVVEGRAGAGAASVSSSAVAAPTMAEGRAEVARLISAGAKRSEAVRQVAASSGLDRRELYRPA